MSKQSFADLGVSEEAIRALRSRGIEKPFLVQRLVIEDVLADRDVHVQSPTGSGKTLAFGVPLIDRVADGADGRSGSPDALVLAPTRELAGQITEELAPIALARGLTIAPVYGGVGFGPQIKRARRADIVVATPGRLEDLLGRGDLKLDRVAILVLDEADRMLDMGFIHAIRRVLKLLPDRRQNLMFSATYSDDIRDLATRLLRDPVTVEVAARNATADRVEQQVYRVPKEHKRHLLAHLIRDGEWQQVLVFTRTKHGANRLAEQLAAAGIATAAIHGNKSQNARVRALSEFKAGTVTALVATEVAARGLDIKELPFVVNYELPNVPEDYVHRIGRTARAGGTGCAVSLVAPDEAGLLKDIERLLRRSLAIAVTPEFAVTVERPAPRPAATPHPAAAPGRAAQPSHRAGRHSRPSGRSFGSNGGRRFGSSRG